MKKSKGNRNPVARALRTLRHKVRPSAKRYNRRVLRASLEG